MPDYDLEVELDPQDSDGLWSIEIGELDRRHDLALLRINGYRADNPLTPLFDFPLHENWTVSTYEYSTTREEEGRIRLSPAARRGHITRMLTVDKLGAAGVKALEVSFPAVRGSSGAPLLYEYKGYHLIGVLVSNAEYHLLPAHVAISLNAANTLLASDEYFLPQGIAVNICHLQSMYERVFGSMRTRAESAARMQSACPHSVIRPDAEVKRKVHMCVAAYTPSGGCRWPRDHSKK